MINIFSQTKLFYTEVELCRRISSVPTYVLTHTHKHANVRHHQCIEKSKVFSMKFTGQFLSPFYMLSWIVHETFQLYVFLLHCNFVVQFFSLMVKSISNNLFSKTAWILHESLDFGTSLWKYGISLREISINMSFMYHFLNIRITTLMRTTTNVFWKR